MKDLHLYLLIFTSVIAADEPTSYPTQFCEGVEYTAEIGEQFLLACNSSISNLAVTACDSSYQEELEWGIANQLYASCARAFCVFNSLDLGFKWMAFTQCYSVLWYDSSVSFCWNGAWSGFYANGELNDTLSSICWHKAPTLNPTEAPTNVPSENPSQSPTRFPTAAPTNMPTKTPSLQPTVVPTESPSQQPTWSPTQDPSPSPTETPTEQPSQPPSESPTVQPSQNPSQAPSLGPTVDPSQSPTWNPTENPTQSPTAIPSQLPSQSPTVPTESPSEVPTTTPTENPTWSPTMSVESETSTFEDFMNKVSWPGFIGILLGVIILFYLIILLSRRLSSSKGAKTLLRSMSSIWGEDDDASANALRDAANRFGSGRKQTRGSFFSSRTVSTDPYDYRSRRGTLKSRQQTLTSVPEGARSDDGTETSLPYMFQPRKLRADSGVSSVPSDAPVPFFRGTEAKIVKKRDKRRLTTERIGFVADRKGSRLSNRGVERRETLQSSANI